MKEKEESFEEAAKRWTGIMSFNIIISGFFAIMIGITDSFVVGILIMFISMITFLLIDIVRLLTRILYNKKRSKNAIKRTSKESAR